MRFKTFAVKLAEGDVPSATLVPKRIQLMRVGSFSSEQYGAFKVTPAMLATMLSNFQAKVRGYEDGRLPIDYFHKNDEEAAGWIESLSVENEGTELWAEVTWTPRAAQMLGDKEIRYTSAEFHFDYQDNESRKKHGPTLFGAGLTNRPFIKGMDAVIELAEGDERESKMNLEQALAKIAELEKQIADMKAASGGDGGDSGGDDVEMMKKELADAKAKLGEFEASAKKAEEEKSLAAAKSAEEAKLAEKKGQFDKMLSEGKVCEAQREAFMGNDTIKFAELAQPVKLSAAGNGGSPAGGGAKTAEDEVLEKAEKLVAADKISMSQAIQNVLLSDVTLRKKYHEQTGVNG